MELNENTLGGTLWVNFLNTKRLINGSLADFLNDHQLFKGWLKDNGLNIEEIHEGKLKEIRELLHLIVEKVLGGVVLKEIEEMKGLDQILHSIPVQLSTNWNHGGIDIVFETDQAHELSLQILQSFIDTSQTYGLERVRQCAHEECILYFLDTSKSGKRKWCSMETCGNRKKASKHYSKTKSSQY